MTPKKKGKRKTAKKKIRKVKKPFARTRSADGRFPI